MVSIQALVCGSVGDMVEEMGLTRHRGAARDLECRGRCCARATISPGYDSRIVAVMLALARGLCK